MLRRLILSVCITGAVASAPAAADAFVIELPDISLPVHTAIALDSQKNAHVIYAAPNVTYGVRSASGWALENVTAFYSDDDAQAALALDRQDVPHVAFCRDVSAGGQVLYGSKSGGAWSFEAVGANGPTREWFSLVLGASPTEVELVYVDRDADDLVYAKRSASGWTIETLDPGDIAGAAKMVRAPSGRLAISYVVRSGGFGPHYVRYLEQTPGGVWRGEAVDTTLGLPEHTSLCFEPDGTAHITYRDGAPMATWLEHAERVVSPTSSSLVTVWKKEVVDSASTGVTGSSSAAAVAPNGDLLVAYMRGGPGLGLKYAVKSAGAWAITYADSGLVPSGIAMTLTSDGDCHASYRRGSKGLAYVAGAVSFASTSVDAPATDASSEAAAAAPRLAPNAPNPFSPRTTIRFDLPSAQPVSLEIFDVSGRRVRTLFDAPAARSGEHAIARDGRDDSGDALASGAYLYRLQTASGVQTRSITLLR